VKITDIKAIPLFIPLKESPPFCANPKRRSYHVLVKVFTDEGITGYGEAIPFTPGAISTFIEEGLKPRLLGENPMHIERLWDMMYRINFGHGIRGISLYAISAVEIALWDIIGKYRSLPVYEMLGGLCKDKIKAYASLMEYKKPEDVASIALRWAEEGYTAIKVHQGGDTVIESVKAVRQAIGYDIVIMVDVNGAWTPRQAVEKAKELEQYGVLWLEEPVWPVDDYDGLAYVKDKSNIPLASGENEHTHYGFREMIAKRAVDIIQPIVLQAGGILECRKIFALAEAWNLKISTNSFFFGPGVAATIHLGLSNMRSEYVEANAVPLEASLIQPPLRPEKGYVTVPDKPGLGIEIDEDVVKKYRVTTRRESKLLLQNSGQ